MNHSAVPTHVPLGVDEHVKGPSQRVALEAVTRGGGRATDPHRLAPVEHEFEELRPKIAGRPGDVKRVRSGLEEGAAPDSASELAVRQAGIRGLRAIERAQLTS